ncbi:MAG: succinate dehydrogenase assembly factor 2 [Pseudomonadota bacterium]|nr:succinate dehydrogenase assembly factor 2 [Pseudomonadota bacterium]
MNNPGDGPDEEARRIWWRSRRGLRELDLLLVPFVEDVLPGLQSADRQGFLRLIDREDTELMELLTRRVASDDPEIADMVERVLASKREVT